MVRAEVSLYPADSDEPGEIAIDSLRNEFGEELYVDIGSLSTRIEGTAQQVWSRLRTLYEQAQQPNREVVMVITLSNTSK